jgi:pyrroline-5-carboxylate reductase
MQRPRIAVIGAGHMARGLIGGLIHNGTEPARLAVADVVPAALEAIRGQFGVGVCKSNTDAVRDAEVVILAVRPPDVKAVLLELEPAIARERPLLISVAAGVRIAAIIAWLDGHARVVRCMPNGPALIGCGVTALYAESPVSERDRTLAQDLLATVGTVVWLEHEAQMDAVTAVSGSGPAYFYLLIEALETAARECGLPADIARTLSVETAHGAGRVAQRRDVAPAVLRAQVASRGGTTEAALRVLEDSDLRGIVSRAVAAAARRAREIADQSER